MAGVISENELRIDYNCHQLASLSERLEQATFHYLNAIVAPQPRSQGSLLPVPITERKTRLVAPLTLCYYNIFSV